MINNLIFDGNYIFHKAVHSLSKTNAFYVGLYTKINESIKNYENMNTWDNIIIVSDSRKKSWRSKIASDYKATRKRDDKIDWDFAYETYEQWKEDISKKYPFFQYDHIEGDDWIFFLTKYFNKKGLGSMIVTSDRDINQLVYSNIDSGYMNIQINDKQQNPKIYVPYNWKIVYDKVLNSEEMNNPFNLSHTGDKLLFFDNMKKINNVIEIDKVNFLFEKIMVRDAGDNVSSIHNTISKTGRVTGVGEKTASKVWDVYSKIYDDFNTSNEDHIYGMYESYEIVKKKKFDLTTKKQILSNIKHNINMMELKISSFPENIRNTIIKNILKTFEY